MHDAASSLNLLKSQIEEEADAEDSDDDEDESDDETDESDDASEDDARKRELLEKLASLEGERERLMKMRGALEARMQGTTLILTLTLTFASPCLHVGLIFTCFIPDSQRFIRLLTSSTTQNLSEATLSNLDPHLAFTMTQGGGEQECDESRLERLQKERAMLVTARDDLRRSAASGMSIDEWRQKWDGNTLVMQSTDAQEGNSGQQGQEIVLDNKIKPARDPNDAVLLHQAATLTVAEKQELAGELRILEQVQNLTTQQKQQMAEATGLSPPSSPGSPTGAHYPLTVHSLSAHYSLI